MGTCFTAAPVMSGGGTGPSIDWEAPEWGAYPSALTLERLKKPWRGGVWSGGAGDFF